MNGMNLSDNNVIARKGSSYNRSCEVTGSGVRKIWSTPKFKVITYFICFTRSFRIEEIL